MDRALTVGYSAAQHILYQQQPTDLDRRYIEICQWLTVEGDYSDLIVEQGIVQDDDDLHTDSRVLPSCLSVKQALSEVKGRKGNSLHG